MTKRVLVVGLISLLGAGCAMKSDVAKLETSLTDEINANSAQQDSLLQEIRQLRAVLLDSLGVQERRVVSGRVDVQRQIDELNESLAMLIALTGQVQQQLARYGPQPVPNNVEPIPDGEAYGQADDGDAPVSSASGPDALYDASLRQFRRGSYGTARTGFEEFLRQYSSHDLASDAQYYLAETYERTDDLEEALAQYARVLELYPNSRRAPAALYKSGLVELQRGNTDDARTFLARVVQGYPDSDEATPAREELRKLQN